MSRLHGKDVTVLSLAAQTLLADTISIEITIGADVHDTTTMGDDWKEGVAGLKGGTDISHEMFYDDTTTTGTWAYVAGLVGGASSSLVVTAGSRTVTVPVIVKEVGLPLTVNDMAKFTATYQMIGAAVIT